MSASPILAMYLRAPDELNALVSIPHLGVVGTVIDITQTLSLTILHLDNGETAWLPKECPVYLDPIAEQSILCDADRRDALTASQAILRQAAMFRTIRNHERETGL